jgi:hypothetical protein
LNVNDYKCNIDLLVKDISRGGNSNCGFQGKLDVELIRLGKQDWWFWLFPEVSKDESLD